MPSFELDPQETEDPDVRHVCISGELDLTNARELEDRVAALAAEERSVVVLDLNRVVFIDSAALHVLFRTARTGRIGIVNWKPGRGGPGPDASERVAQSVVEADAAAAGLKVVDHEDLPYQYLLVLSR